MDEEKLIWKPVEPDTRGYTNCFECPSCGVVVRLGTYMKACDYDFCPYCGAVVFDGREDDEQDAET